MARGNKLRGTNIYLDEDYSEAIRRELDYEPDNES